VSKKSLARSLEPAVEIWLFEKKYSGNMVRSRAMFFYKNRLNASKSYFSGPQNTKIPPPPPKKNTSHKIQCFYSLFSDPKNAVLKK
jgi:hypothetical protein